MHNLQNALKYWGKLLGEQYILSNERILRKAQTTTFPTKSRVLAIIKPADRRQVQECVRIANTYKIKIYPISTGKNWGYGSTVPPANNCVIMDLSRMNNIVEFDEKLAFVTVEPGVTFRQLYKFLKRQKSNLVISTSGGSQDSSLIGITAERGIGKGIYGNRHEFICGLEVILPTGECIHTGFKRFSNSKAGSISREGIGPFVDGLFIQSNLGIITQMTIWLIPRPKYFQTFTFSVNKEHKLQNIIDNLRILKFENVVRGNFLISNDYRILASLCQYPWKETKDNIPLPQSIFKLLKRKHGVVDTWYGYGVLAAGTMEEGRVQKNKVLKILNKDVHRLIIMNENIFQSYAKLQRLKFEPISELLQKLTQSFTTSVFRGIPTDKSLASMYWRKKMPVPKRINPEADRCGLVWVSPVIPFDGKDVLEVVSIITKIMMEFGFEPNLGINCLTERMVNITASIIYDRFQEGGDDKAMECREKLLNKLSKRGYIPYRLDINSMSLLPKPVDDYGYFLRKLKQALDPNDILAPNRYDFRDTWYT